MSSSKGRRIYAANVREGDQGFIHGNVGKSSSRKTGEKKRERYGDFRPMLAAEKLAEEEGAGSVPAGKGTAACGDFNDNS
jgi:hypothetical protein